MTIVMAKILGFCGGVRRAVGMIETELAEHGPFYTLGAIVHNARVVDDLARKGARIVEGLDEVPDGGTVAITAHGAGEEIHDEIARRGLRLVDTTCPIVRKAQETVARLVEDGFSVVLYGEAQHPEVRGILSWTRGRGIATQSFEVEIQSGSGGIAVISQTTGNPDRFTEFSESIVKRFTGRVPEIRIIDTTCPETGRRYQAAQALAKTVDVLFAVGSRTSANTRKLVETCRETGVPTHHIELADEIEDKWFKGRDRVGVTAGASTPDAVIEEVVQRLGRSGEGVRAGAQSQGEPKS